MRNGLHAVVDCVSSSAAMNKLSALLSARRRQRLACLLQATGPSTSSPITFSDGTATSLITFSCPAVAKSTGLATLADIPGQHESACQALPARSEHRAEPSHQPVLAHSRPVVRGQRTGHRNAPWNNAQCPWAAEVLNSRGWRMHGTLKGQIATTPRHGLWVASAGIQIQVAHASTSSTSDGSQLLPDTTVT